MIKLGIIGTGSMANNHAAEFKGMRGVRLTACCDIVKKTARDFAKQHEIANCYTDYEQMLRSAPLDAVSIVVNDKFHAPIAIAAAKKGLHVLCEKPLATNPKDAWGMVKAAKKAGRVLAPFQNRRILFVKHPAGHRYHLNSTSSRYPPWPF